MMEFEEISFESECHCEKIRNFKHRGFSFLNNYKNIVFSYKNIIYKVRR